MVDVSGEMSGETGRRERNRRERERSGSEVRKREGELKEGWNIGYLLQACVLLHTSICRT